MEGPSPWSYLTKARHETPPDCIMSALVESFSILVLLVLGLPSLEGNYGGQKLMSELELVQAFDANKGETKLRVDEYQEKKLDTRTNIRKNLGAKPEQNPQTNWEEIETIKIQDQLQSNVMKRPYLEGNRQAHQKLEFLFQPQINAKKREEAEHREQSQLLVQKSLEAKPKNRVWITLRQYQRQHPETVVSLWTRGQGSSSKSGGSLTNYKDPRRNPALPSQFYGNLSPPDNAPSPKRRNKITQLLAKSLAKTKRSFSGKRGSKNSRTEDSSAPLTSGYTQKPSGLGQAERHAQASGSQPLWQSSNGGGQDRPTDSTLDWSPARSPEVNQMWDFINRHSRNWSNAEGSPSTRDNGKSSEDTKRNGSPPKRKSPPTSSRKSSKEPQNVEQQSSGSKGDKDARKFIKRHRKGWDSSEGKPAKDASSSSSEKESPSRSPQGPKSSPPSSLPRSASRSSPPGKQLYQMNNKELDKEYDSFITRVRSRTDMKPKDGNNGH